MNDVIWFMNIEIFHTSTILSAMNFFLSTRYETSAQHVWKKKNKFKISSFMLSIFTWGKWMSADSIETLNAYEICMWKIISIGLSKTNKILFHHIFCGLCSESERLKNFAEYYYLLISEFMKPKNCRLDFSKWIMKIIWSQSIDKKMHFCHWHLSLVNFIFDVNKLKTVAKSWEQLLLCTSVKQNPQKKFCIRFVLKIKF